MAVPREVIFEADEYGRRLAAVQAAMAEAGIDLLVTGSPANICYLDGYDSVNLLDLMFLAVPAEGGPVHYLWQFERGRFESSAVGSELMCWDTGVEPIGFVVDDLKKRGLSKGRIAVDTGSTYTPYDIVRRLMDGLGAEPVKGLIETIRLVKSPAEHAQIRKAAVITDAGAKAALETIGEGASDYDISGAALAAMLAHGSDTFINDPIICVGWRSGTPHTPRGGGRCRSGEPVFVELTGVSGRYTCPIMRTGVPGQAGPELRELADHSNACLDAMIAEMKAGAVISEVANAGRKALAPILDKITFHHLYGYPVGIGFAPNWIENPDFYMSLVNHAPLKAGMVFHLPLMLRVLGQYGAGFSQTVIVTEGGAEVMSKLPRTLTV